MSTNTLSVTTPMPSTQSRKAGFGFWNRNFSHLLTRILVKYYIWIIAALGVIIILSEASEHLSGGRFEVNFFTGEVAFGILLSIMTVLLTRLIIIMLAERTKVINTLRAKNNLDLILSASQDVREITRRLVQQIALVAPLEKIELYLYDKGKNWFDRVAYPSASSSEQVSYVPPAIDPAPCQQCLAQRPSSMHPLALCRQGECVFSDGQSRGYCLPLSLGSRPVGLLFLTPPDHQDLVIEQRELVENLSTEMSSALYIAIENKTREEAALAEKIDTLQMDIARDLHDTLGQNISYLRMKLDVLSEMPPKTKAATEIEIRRMVEVANEAYEMVRGTLDVLQSGRSADLFHLFNRHAEQVAERAAFKINLSSQGKPKSLSQSLIRQLFFIFREALSNIEKHADASQVDVRLHWDENNLALEISDDGCGFDPASILSGHYGLKFMRERTRSLQGLFTIHSAIGAGTNVMITVPCD